MFVPEPFVEPSPRHVRVQLDDVTVADTRRALLLSWYGPGMLPTYAIPPEDVQVDLLRPSTGAAGLPHTTPHDVVGDREVPGAAFRFEAPPSPDRCGGRALDLRLGHRSRLVRGGAGGARPRPRHPQAGRRRPERPSRPRRARRRGPGREPSAARAVRDHPPHPLVPALRGRAHGAARRLRHHDSLPVQGHGRVLVGPDRRHPPPGPRMELRRARDRVPADRRARRFFGERVDLWVDGELVARPDTPWSQPED